MWLGCLILFFALSYAWKPREPYQPPGPGDARPPCPALATLANHNELPRTGWVSEKGLLSALKRVFNVCPELPGRLFTTAFIKEAPPQYPPPVSEIYTLALLQLRPNQKMEAALSRTDAEAGNMTLFNEEIFLQTVSHSKDGKYMTLDDFINARRANLERTAKRTGRPVSKDSVFRTAGDIGFIWLGFANRKPILISDLKSFFQGKFPENWSPPEPWCIVDWVKIVSKEYLAEGIVQKRHAFYEWCEGTIFEPLCSHFDPHHNLDHLDL